MQARLRESVVLAALAAAPLLVSTACAPESRPDKEAAPAAEHASTKPGPNRAPKKVAVHGEAGAPGAAAANPHGANPHAANPHGANPPGTGRVIPTAQPKASEPVEITPDGKTTKVELMGLSFAVPSQWERQPPANRMRIDQYDVPGPAGGASLGVFRFPGGGGSTTANIDRWVGQFDQPDGRPSKEVAKIETKEVGGLSVTTVSVTGTYKGSMSMRGQPSATAQENAQLLAAIVAGSGDPYFFKLSGPQKTVEVWTEQWAALAGSFALATGTEAGAEAKPEAQEAAKDK